MDNKRRIKKRRIGKVLILFPEVPTGSTITVFFFRTQSKHFYGKNLISRGYGISKRRVWILDTILDYLAKRKEKENCKLAGRRGSWFELVDIAVLNEDTRKDIHD